MPGRIVDQSHFFPKGLLGKEKDFGWWSSVGIGRYSKSSHGNNYLENSGFNYYH